MKLATKAKGFFLNAVINIQIGLHLTSNAALPVCVLQFSKTVQ